MHGQGKFTWPDGRVYEGDYVLDKMEGYGIYTWTDGKQYEGQWLRGKHHGKGIYRKNGVPDRYGIWENGKRIKWIEEAEDNQVGQAQENGVKGLESAAGIENGPKEGMQNGIVEAVRES